MKKLTKNQKRFVRELITWAMIARKEYLKEKFEYAQGIAFGQMLGLKMAARHFCNDIKDDHL